MITWIWFLAPFQYMEIIITVINSAYYWGIICLNRVWMKQVTKFGCGQRREKNIKLINNFSSFHKFIINMSMINLLLIGQLLPKRLKWTTSNLPFSSHFDQSGSCLSEDILVQTFFWQRNIFDHVLLKGCHSNKTPSHFTDDVTNAIKCGSIRSRTRVAHVWCDVGLEFDVM